MEHDPADWPRGWERRMFHGWSGLGARRGDIAPIILGVLAERPMHGYEIIRELENRTHGMWRPSPGSVYPTLQLLEEQDLVTGQDKTGKRIYSITDAGQKLAETTETRGPRPGPEADIDMTMIMEIKGTFIQFASTFRTVMRASDPGRQAEALRIVAQAEAKLRKLSGDNSPQA